LYAQVVAIADSPVFGHGSWATGKTYALRVLRDLAQAGYPINPATAWTFTHSEHLPTHSYLLGAWVEGGALATVFWLVVIGLCVHFLLRYYKRSDPFIALLTFVVIGLLWDTMFSPFGAQERLEVAYGLVLLLFARREEASEPAAEKEVHAARVSAQSPRLRPT
jgi:O-antigen ligase